MSLPRSWTRALGALGLLSATAGALAPATPALPTTADDARAAAPVFVANRGQHPPAVRYVARQGELTAFFTADAFVLSLAVEDGARHALALRFEGVGEGASVRGVDRLPGRVHSFQGDDPARWVRGAETYPELRYDDLRAGVDLRVLARAGRLAYDLLLEPGADLDGLAVRCEGVDRLELRADDLLVLHTAAGPVEQRLPAAWEVDADGGTHPVAARFRLLDGRRFGFEVPDRDPDRALVIDPGVSYGTYLGGGLLDEAAAVGLAPDGDLIVAGTTGSANFPVTPGAQQGARAGNNDAFLARLDAVTGQLVYATYFGGNDATTFEPEGARDLAVAADGSVCLVGRADSADFPLTPGTVGDRRPNGANGFVARFDAAGDLLWTTLLGGGNQDEAEAVALMDDGRVVVAGTTFSDNFPTTPGAADETFNSLFFTNDLFVSRLTADGTVLEYSTYGGGSLRDEALDLALAADGSAVVTGLTGSPDFPTTAGAFDETFNGAGPQDTDAFVLRLTPAGDAVSWATVFGGLAIVEASSLALAAGEEPVFAGFTRGDDLPVPAGAFQPAYGGGDADGFAARLDSSGATLRWATYFGGSGEDVVHDLALTSGDLPTLAGGTTSPDLPTLAAAPVATVAGDQGLGGATSRAGQGPGVGPGVPNGSGGGSFFPVHDDTLGGARDAFVARLGAGGGSLRAAAYHGGSGSEDARGLALDGFGAAVLAGDTSSPDLPLAGPVLDSTLGGPGDAFLARLALPPFEDLGAALAGHGGEAPRLGAEGDLVAGAPLRLELSGARPGAPVFLLVSGTQGAVPLAGGLLRPVPVERVLPVRAGADGGWSLASAALPGALPAGARLVVQAWVLDEAGPEGLAASNALGLLAP